MALVAGSSQVLFVGVMMVVALLFGFQGDNLILAEALTRLLYVRQPLPLLLSHRNSVGRWSR